MKTIYFWTYEKEKITKIFEQNSINKEIKFQNKLVAIEISDNKEALLIETILKKNGFHIKI